MDAKITKLENGLRVITAGNPGFESAALGLFIGAGSRYETRRNAGISHFLEHLLFKGTHKRTSRRITQEIEGRGGYMNAYTQEESTCYYARVTSEEFGRAFDILSDMYLDPLLKQKDIEKERGVIIEEIMMYRDQPSHQVQEMLGEALWNGHPLGRPIIGSPESLARLTREDFTRFKTEMYLPSNTVVAAAGNVSHEACVEQARSFAEAMARRPKRTFEKVTATVKQRDIALHEKDVKQSHLAMGFRLPFGRGDKRRFALRLLSAVLGENMSSRLFQVVRERHGLAYSVHSSVHLFSESGALVISAGLDTRRQEKAARLIMNEVAKLKETRVGKAELNRARVYVKGCMRLGLESASHQMTWLGDNLLAHDRFVSPAEVLAGLDAVTADDIGNLGQSVFRSARASLALVSPNVPVGADGAYREIMGAL